MNDRRLFLPDTKCVFGPGGGREARKISDYNLETKRRSVEGGKLESRSRDLAASGELVAFLHPNKSKRMANRRRVCIGTGEGIEQWRAKPRFSSSETLRNS